MSFSSGLSPLLLAACILVAAGLTYYAYRRTTPPVSRGWRWLLGGLRFTALALLLFLLFEPVVRQLTHTERPPVLAVLIDDSKSLQVTSGGNADTTADPQATVGAALRRITSGGVPGQMAYYAFSTDVEALDGARLPDSLRFDGDRTDIAAALEDIRDELQDVNLQGVVLLSDGQYNTGRNPLYVADRFSTPIHTVVVGDTARHRDVQIRRVATNDIAYVDTELPLQIGLRSESAGGEQVTVALYRNDERVDQQRVRLAEGTAEVSVDLSYTPEATGLQRLVVRVTEIDGEITYRNNERAVTVRVLENKRRVLLLGAAPSPTFAAVRRLLERDEDTEVAPFVPRGDGSFYQGALPTDLSSFDVFVLAGFPGPTVSPDVLERVAAASEDMPLLFLLDQQTDLHALRDAFGDVLPVQPEQIRPSYVEASLVPSSQSQQHPIFDIPELRPASWQQLPPLQFNESRWVASPDARVLATNQVRGVALDDPMLAIRERAGHRSAALVGAGTWRWTNLPDDLRSASPIWPALFGNAIEWVATREDDRPVRVEPVQETFAGSERITFTGQVYDESLNPVNDAAVQVNVQAPDGSRYPYPMTAVGNGRYVLEVGSLPEGSYTYTAEATREGTTLGQDRGQFAVGALTLEFQNTRADATLMRQIAQRSGGSFFTAEEADQLPAQLSDSESFVPLTVTSTQELELWHTYGFLALIVVLLAAEWILRKRSGMV